MNESLLEQWRMIYNAMNGEVVDIDAQIAALQEERNKLAAPYQWQLDELGAEIRQQALDAGKGLKAHGVQVSYRSGYVRVSYDKDKVDAVLGVLKDVLPQTAITLEKARSESEVSPSVSIKPV